MWGKVKVGDFGARSLGVEGTMSEVEKRKEKTSVHERVQSPLMFFIF